MVQVRIEVVKSSRLNLGQFEQGVPTTSVLDGLDFERTDDVIQAETPHVRFEGQKASSNYVIGKFDPETNVLKIMPVTTFQIKQKTIKSAPKTGVLTEKEKRKRLVDQFGSKAIQKSSKTREQFKMEKIVGKYERVESDKSFILPPHDISGTDMESAYPLDDVFPPNLRNHLVLFSTGFKKRRSAEEIIRESPYDTLVHDLLKKGLDKNEKPLYFKLLEFLGILIRFTRYPARISGDSETHFSKYFGERIDDSVVAFLKETFCEILVDGEGRKVVKMNSNSVSKVFCYLLVVYFHILGENVPLFEIAQSLGLPETKIKVYFEQIGARINKDDKQASIATIKFPLTFKGVGRRVNK
jgi:hypothetical protein